MAWKGGEDLNGREETCSKEGSAEGGAENGKEGWKGVLASISGNRGLNEERR